MPVDFLTPEQEQAYGRYAGDPPAVDLERVFHLDDADRAFIAARRGDHNRLGLALQLGTVRYLGTFLDDPTAVPPSVVATLAAQLGLADTEAPACLARYGAGETRWDHTALIRQRYGYRDFVDQPGHWRFVRWLYARAWTGAERPSALFAQAVARLAARPAPAQRAALEHLVLGTDDQRQTPLDRLRRGPVQANSVTLVAALKRLQEVRAQPPAGAGPARGYRVRPEPGAHAAGAPGGHLAGLRVLEATATDDVLDVFDQILDEMLRGAARTAKKRRLATVRALDAAALVLRDVARVVRDPRCHDPEVRATVATLHGDGEIDAAIATVDALARPPVDHHQSEIVEQYPMVRRFLPTLLRTIRFEGIAGARPLLEALDFLAALDGPQPPEMVEAPLAAVPKAWRERVRGPGPTYRVDRKAYTCAILAHTQEALRRHDLFLMPSERWADLQAKLLQGPAWEAARPQVCRALNHALDPTVELAVLGDQPDDAYRRTAAHLATNPDVRLERRRGRDRLVLTRLEHPDEPASLRHLRTAVDGLLPHAELPEVLLEIHGVTGFADAFTHVSEENARVEDLSLSLCAVLLAEACNIGLRAVAREDVPALTIDRLSWVKHNYLRPETLAQANARLVDYHQTLAVTIAWGRGEIASVDGLRFKVPVKTLTAGYSPPYFGAERGATWLNMASGHLGLHGVLVPGTLRDSGRILDVVLEQPTSLHPMEIVSDTAGYADIVFGVFALLGYQFSPRLADLGDQRLWRLDPKADYGPLNSVSRHHVPSDLIARYWDDLLRLTGSLHQSTIAGSEALRLLQSGERYSTLGRAVAAYGRIAKSLFLPAALSGRAQLSPRVLQQINR